MADRRDISFPALDGTILRGWFYPAGGNTPAGSGPSVAISHGFACLKEWYLDDLASAFQRHGIASLVYDHRNVGSSDGTPRDELDPDKQAQDVHDAVTFLLQQPGVDANRVGVFGYSYSALHAVRAGALDRRIRAVVSLSSLLSGDWLLRLAGGDREAADRIVWEDRAARLAGREEPRYFPMIPTDEDGKENAIFPMPNAIEFYGRMRRTKSPEWGNKVTVQSQAMIRSCDVHPYLPLLAPTPLLMLADQESLESGIYQKAFEIAVEPKQWGTYPGGHFDGLQGEGFEIVVQTSVGFFKKWLGN